MRIKEMVTKFIQKIVSMLIISVAILVGITLLYGVLSLILWQDLSVYTMFRNR